MTSLALAGLTVTPRMAGHSTLMFFSFTSLVHRTTSVAICLPKSSGEPGVGTAASRASSLPPSINWLTVGVDEGLDRDQPDGRGSNVTITIINGASASYGVDHPCGHSLHGGATWAEFSEKWHEGLPGCDVGRMVSLVQRLEDLDDVKELADSFLATN